MPAADANAFKTLRRNHALLNRKSRDAFDIYKKNTRLKPVTSIKIPKLTAEQQVSIRNKIRTYKSTERKKIILKTAITLIASPFILYYLFQYILLII